VCEDNNPIPPDATTKELARELFVALNAYSPDSFVEGHPDMPGDTILDGNFDLRVIAASIMRTSLWRRRK
jgi:hypothetical protein